MKSKEKKIFYHKDEVTIGYYDKVFEKKSGVQSKWQHQKFNFIKKLMNNYSKHLDFGCSSGTFIWILNTKKESIGVDISKSQISYAKSKYKKKNNKFYSTGLPLPFKNNTFDVVTILEVIEHCNKIDNTKIIKEIYRVLKPGGILIATTPNYSSLWPLLEKLISFFGPVDYTKQHVNYFNKKKLSFFFEKNNFIKQKVSTFIYFSPFVASLSWSLSNLMEKIENNFFKTGFGFLLCGVFKKK